MDAGPRDRPPTRVTLPHTLTALRHCDELICGAGTLVTAPTVVHRALWRRQDRSRAGADMADGQLPGFIPQVARRDDVSLPRADETVFNAMVGTVGRSCRHRQ